MSRRVTCDILGGKVAPVNCKISGGGVIPAAYPELIGTAVPQNIIYACRAESAGRFFLCTQTDAFVSVSGGEFTRLNSLAGTSPFLVEEVNGGVPRAVLINGANAVAHEGTKFYGVHTGVNLVSGVMRCGRLFAADGENKLMLRWSGEGGIGDWEQKMSGAGYLLLDPEYGEILGLIAFGEKIIAVRRYGLTGLNAFGNPENFSVGITDTRTEEICGGTAAVVCGKLLFYTRSGLRCFDGSRVTPLGHRYSAEVKNPAFPISYDGKYYLACETGAGRSVLVYDCADGESYIHDIAADGMCAADGVCIFNCSGAYRLGEAQSFSFTAEFDFCSGKDKTVTGIFIGGKADIEIKSGRKTRAFSGASGIIRPKLRGKSFTVKVTGTGVISALTATAEVLNGI